MLAFSPDDSFEKINIVVSWLVLFFLMSNTATDQRKFYLMIVLFLVWSTKMSQHGARAFLTGSGSAGGAPGYFQNTGEFALQMCIYVPLAIYFIFGLRPLLSKQKVLILSLLPVAGILGIINSGSRGGFLGLAAVGLWMLWRSKHKLRGFASLIVLVPILWLLTPEYQKERFRTAGDDETSVSRLVYWKRGVEMANKHPLLGVGYENWVPYSVAFYPPKSGELVKWIAPGVYAIEVSHNIFIEVLSQLGYTGLILFSSILAYTWVLNRRTRLLLKQLGEQGRFLREISYGLDAGVIGFIVAGFFMAVAFYPFAWVQLGLAGALHSAALRTIASTGGTTPRTAQFRTAQPVAGWRSRRIATGAVRA
jgi:putative inorganic carbon (HCO3(-)) transporter